MSDPQTSQLKALLPPGAAFNTDSTSEVSATLQAVGTEFARVQSRADAMLSEADPRTATETLDAWQRVLALPSSQPSVGASVPGPFNSGANYIPPQVVASPDADVPSGSTTVTISVTGDAGQWGYSFDGFTFVDMGVAVAGVWIPLGSTGLSVMWDPSSVGNLVSLDTWTATVITLAHVRRIVTQAFTRVGGQTPAYFVALAAAGGYTATVYDAYGSTILRAGFLCGAQSVGVDWAHAWKMIVSAPTGGAVSHAQLESVIRASAPAHTVVVFQYL